MLDKLPIHYSMQNLPTVYDEEALTALELAARTTAKVNETVEAFNTLETETNEHLEQQDAELATAIGAQNARLNTFETKTIPEEVDKQIDDNVENGRFAAVINEYAGDLEARLDNLVANTPSGSTTMDAEVIDARVGYQNTAFGSLGEAARFQARSHNEDIGFLRDTVASLFSGVKSGENNQKLLFEANGWMGNDGYLVDNIGNLYARTAVFAHPGPFSIKADYEVYTIRIMNLWEGGVLASPTFYKAEENKVYNPAYPYYALSIWRNDGAAINPAEVDMYLCRHYDNAILDKALCGEQVMVDASNYETLLPDLNISGPAMVKMLFAKGATDIPSGLPFTTWPGGVGLLIAGVADAKGNYQTQALFTTNGVYFRYSGTANDFPAWVDLSRVGITGTPYLSVSAGGSILETLKACYANGYKKLVVEAGEYDLLAEYEAHYGADYFTNYVNYSTSDKFDRGLWLENIEVVFSPGAKVKANYTGSNEAVKAYFAPIACGNNVTIDGLVLEASNLRYGIHPDFNTGTDVSTMVIRNCDLSHHKGTSCKAIGAGFGIHVDWLVENTIFRTKTAESVFSVHNHADSTAKSRLTVRNCYIDGNGYFAFNGYGASTEQTEVIMSGCSYVTEPVVGLETTGSKDNVTLRKFCNEKRNG